MTADLYHFLYHGLSLKTVGLVIGAVLVATHLFGFLKFEALKPILRDLPRNVKVGIAILAVDFAWALLIWSEMDLGEFFNLERPVQMVLIAGFFGVAIYVQEFLAVRAIGFFLILAACPVLNAAFLEPPVTRLLLVALAYVWIVKGMFWVGMPYLMRDQLAWATAEPNRWKALTLAGVAYGALVLVCALAFY
ncbi:MAG: hypothetical protein KDM63_08500 [Verrucomicrobiae bacterium]|nr:hypothetical protein [Verrucomicrobiae bacterium]MCB1087071.1 hypothetical protein [Verrucomicrobiae bacterium]